jgi:hypothetical protein
LVPHPPQLKLSPWVSTHALPHKVLPVGHALAHLPLAQDTEPPVGAVQPLPQLPQLAESVLRFLQLPLQALWPVGQLLTQLPP